MEKNLPGQWSYDGISGTSLTAITMLLLRQNKGVPIYTCIFIYFVYIYCFEFTLDSWELPHFMGNVGRFSASPKTIETRLKSCLKLFFRHIFLAFSQFTIKSNWIRHFDLFQVRLKVRKVVESVHTILSIPVIFVQKLITFFIILALLWIVFLYRKVFVKFIICLTSNVKRLKLLNTVLIFNIVVIPVKRIVLNRISFWEFCL